MEGPSTASWTELPTPSNVIRQIENKARKELTLSDTDEFPDQTEFCRRDKSVIEDNHQNVNPDNQDEGAEDSSHYSDPECEIDARDEGAPPPPPQYPQDHGAAPPPHLIPRIKDENHITNTKVEDTTPIKTESID